jgi:hypothetical protein
MPSRLAVAPVAMMSECALTVVSVPRTVKGREDRSTLSTSSVHSTAPHRSAWGRGAWEERGAKQGWAGWPASRGRAVAEPSPQQARSNTGGCLLLLHPNASLPLPTVAFMALHSQPLRAGPPRLPNPPCSQRRHPPPAPHLRPHAVHQVWAGDALREAREVLHLGSGHQLAAAHATWQ